MLLRRVAGHVGLIRVLLIAMILFYLGMQVYLHATNPADAAAKPVLVELPEADPPEPVPLPEGHMSALTKEPSQGESNTTSRATPPPSDPTSTPKASFENVPGCARVPWTHVTIGAYCEGNVLSLQPRDERQGTMGRGATDWVPSEDVTVLPPDPTVAMMKDRDGSLRLGKSARIQPPTCTPPSEPGASHENQNFPVSDEWVAFSVVLDGSSLHTLRVQFREAEVLGMYGLPMRGDSVALPDERSVSLINLDINHYALDSTLGLYGTVPLVYVTLREGSVFRTVGVFWLNGSPAKVRRHNGELSFEGTFGGMRVFILRGPTPRDVLAQYYCVTGRPALPPAFALGYHQCRWSYRDESDVLRVHETFLEKDIPCDAIWLDIDHTDRKHYFTWDHEKFPDPEAMQRRLWSEAGRRMVTISDPHIAADPGYFVYQEARQGGYFVRNEDGSDFEGHCWPGASSWIDFTDPEARRWYAGLFTHQRYRGSTEHLYTWLDMNEPSVFSGPQLTLPMSKLHKGGLLHGVVHNLYGFYHSMAAFEGHLARANGKTPNRPFLLTRSFFAGSHRYAAVWSGDNQAQWSHLSASIPHVLQMSLGGIPFVGADVGGFFDDPEPQLVLRWYQLGSLYPFFRGHSHEATRRREPWTFSGPVNAKVAQSIRFRYELLPYLYTSFWRLQDTMDGSGLWQPLWMGYPTDPGAYNVTDTFLVGPSLIARPICDSRSTRYSLYVPQTAEGELELLYDFWTGRTLSHSANVVPLMEDDRFVVPLFIVAGAVVPLKSKHASTVERLQDAPHRLIIAPTENGDAEGELYLDDGISMRYATEREFCVVSFSYFNGTLNASASSCAWPQTEGARRWATTATLTSITLFHAPSTAGRAIVSQYEPYTATSTAKSTATVATSAEKGRAADAVQITGLSLPLHPNVGKPSSWDQDGTLLWSVSLLPPSS